MDPSGSSCAQLTSQVQSSVVAGPSGRHPDPEPHSADDVLQSILARKQALRGWPPTLNTSVEV